MSPFLPRRGRHALLLAALAAVGGCQPNLRAGPSAPAAVQPYNVIVMINDGAGWGTWDAAAYWQYGSREGAPYAAFPQRLAVTTFPLNSSSQPTGDTAQTLGYDAARAWNTEAVPALDLPFAGYQYLAAVATDSAAAGTALSAGIKTYNNAINVDNEGRAVDFNTLRAKRLGMATGVVTSVPFAHATPAAFAAQNPSRNNYHAIAHQMLAQGHMDLVMGTGGPGYSVDGRACGQGTAAAPAEGCANPWEWVSQQDWQQLEAGSTIGGNPAGPWRLIRSKEDFLALAQGRLPADRPLIGVPRVANTLQQARQRQVLGQDASTPSGVRRIDSVPDLATMTRGALRFLQQRSAKGLFLMVEGGATDWAAHTSACGTEWHYGSCSDQPQYGRLIEETVEFNDAVAAVVEWIEHNGGWERSLLIVTTDHDNSMPMGPDAQNIAFEPVRNNGRGRMPGMSFRPTGNHSNALVPLWAKGAGAELLGQRVRGVDAGYRQHVRWNDGRYIDNTDVAAAVQEALQR
ncbi:MULTISPECIES: alkaline phosphatase [unclassified Stenotrophomonas]|uniref:alkaline phosphatase n=1 Tax=unclassified Stenotrophomonas TaxID=196198 RepID=UPI000D17C830|nr:MULTISPECIES: alkaline phosphatase [unclassified Stenotrophomonas]PTA71266.1 PhoA [Stenotrophomonas sp. Nf1]PTA79677.1 PhoA [Stenotrophomonas sp. Nf4]